MAEFTTCILSDVYSGYYGGNSRVCMCACICVCVCVRLCVCARTSFATCIISKKFGTCLWCLYGTMCLNKLLKWMKFKYCEYLFKSLSHSLSVVSLYYGGQPTVIDESLVMDRSASRRRIACHASHCFLQQSSFIMMGGILTIIQGDVIITWSFYFQNSCNSDLWAHIDWLVLERCNSILKIRGSQFFFQIKVLEGVALFWNASVPLYPLGLPIVQWVMIWACCKLTQKYGKFKIGV